MQPPNKRAEGLVVAVFPKRKVGIMKNMRYLIIILAIVAVLVGTAAYGDTTEDFTRIVQGKIQLESADMGVFWYIFDPYRSHPDKEKRARKDLLQVKYEDGEGDMYIKLKYWKADGEFLWLAGQCIRDTKDNLQGRWLFTTIHDGGDLGKYLDHVWWEWLPDEANAEENARAKVESIEKASKNLDVRQGNLTIRVKSQE